MEALDRFGLVLELCWPGAEGAVSSNLPETVVSPRVDIAQFGLSQRMRIPDRNRVYELFGLPQLLIGSDNKDLLGLETKPQLPLRVPAFGIDITNTG